MRTPTLPSFLIPKTRTEKLLLFVVFLVLFGGANFYGYEWFSQHQSQLILDAAQLRADRAEGEVDLQKESLWAQRKAWIQEHQPKVGDAGDAGAQVLEYVLKGARDHKLEIVEQSLSDTQQGAAGTRVNVSIKVKGSMENMCRWLSELQQPTDFYAIPTFSMKADQDQKSMVCSMQVARFFKP